MQMLYFPWGSVFLYSKVPSVFFSRRFRFDVKPGSVLSYIPLPVWDGKINIHIRYANSNYFQELNSYLEEVFYSVCCLFQCKKFPTNILPCNMNIQHKTQQKGGSFSICFKVFSCLLFVYPCVVKVPYFNWITVCLASAFYIKCMTLIGWTEMCVPCPQIHGKYWIISLP